MSAAQFAGDIVAGTSKSGGITSLIPGMESDGGSHS